MRSVILAAVQLAFVGGLVHAQPQDAAAQTTRPSLAYVDLARVTSESEEGKKANARMSELREQKRSELEARNTQAQGEVSSLNQQLVEAQEKLQQGQNVISADAAASLQRDIGRLQVDIQRKTQDSQADLTRMTEDAEVDVQRLSNELQVDFEARLTPLIDQLATENGLALIMNVQSLVWADPTMDLTQELIDLLDSSAATTP